MIQSWLISGRIQVCVRCFLFGPGCCGCVELEGLNGLFNEYYDYLFLEALRMAWMQMLQFGFMVLDQPL